LAAVRTGLVAAELGGLLGGGGLEGTSDQAAHGGDGHIFQSGQVDIGTGSLLSEGLFADDFSPASSEFMDGVEVLLSESALCHLMSLLEVASICEDELPFTILDLK
jgi:hypothetical protein